ncbi:MAG: hypothetical protein PHY80_03215, partial [Rickettsiales bacterium]|nr:hypothetical protein [Rickettsiales bacterium]
DIQKVNKNYSESIEEDTIKNEEKTGDSTLKDDVENEEDSDEENEDEEEDNLDTSEDGSVKNKDDTSNDFSICDKDIADLERVNDDFASEIAAERKKTEQEEKKRIGEVEEEEKENVELEPLKNDGKLENIAELNLSNIEEFLKKNGKQLCQLNEETKQEDKTVNKKVDEKSTTKVKNNDDTKKPNIGMNLFDKALNNLKLDENLWNSLKLSNEAKKKILDKVRAEIRKFIKNNVVNSSSNK